MKLNTVSASDFKIGMYASLIRTVLILLALIGWFGWDARAGQRANDSSVRKVDEYVLWSEQQWTRLDRFVKQLMRERGKRAYIIVYGQRRINGSGVDYEDSKMWVYHNLKARRIGEGRFTTVYGGLREQSMIELWIVGPGATPPVPTPTATETVVCPTVSVIGDIYVLRREQPLSFRTQLWARRVSNFPNVTFQWTVSSGRIINGQGTDAITVDASQSSQSSIEATVKVAGLSQECEDTDSATTAVAVIPYKFDEFGSIQSGDLKARLDHLAIYLQNDATLRGHVIVYGGRYGKRGEAKAWGGWMKDYLINSRGLGAQQVVIVDGGYRDERSAELWLVPQNHAGPAASPSVDPKDVVHEKRLRKLSRKN